MNIQPTESQQQLLDKVKVWYRNWQRGLRIGNHPQWFSYSGAAGVGKGVSARLIIDMLGLTDEEYIACAYIGKAVLQLRKNGMNSKTIHALIYDAVMVTVTNEQTGKKYRKFEFELKRRLDEDYKLIFIDEAGMVNDDMVKEILSFGVPVIFMGDMNQLPPVFGFSTVLQKPDHILTQIMRQKEDDPIVQLSQMVLKGIPIFEGEYGRSKVMRSMELDKSLLTDYDQILCNTHKYREALNKHIRENLKHYSDHHPVIGDKVVCCQNHWELKVGEYSLTNGMIGTITDINRQSSYKGYYLIDFAPDFFDDGREFINLKLDKKYINLPYDQRRLIGKINNEKFEYGYAITVYKSQGSEFDRVLYFDSFFRDIETTRRSRYTAITRAKQALTIVLNSSSNKMK